MTRAWTAAITVVSILEQCKIVNELDLLYSYKQVFVGHEYWRLLTSFVYFGPFSINLIMYAYFVARYSRMLEESFYLNRASQYMWLIAVIATSIVVLASFLPARRVALPRALPRQRARVYLGTAKPTGATEPDGPFRLFCTLPTMGFNAFLGGGQIKLNQGRVARRIRGPHGLLSGGHLSEH